MATNLWLAFFQIMLWVADGENIVAVNNSYGSTAPVPAGGATVACDSRNTSDLWRRLQLMASFRSMLHQFLRQEMISFRNGVSFPACVSTAISVGNTTKNDNVQTLRISRRRW